jgi:hypothetical protein
MTSMTSPRLSRGLCLLLGLGLLAGACGHKPTTTATSQSPSEPTTTVTASVTPAATTPAASPTPGPTPSATRKATPTPTRAAPATPAPAPLTPAVPSTPAGAQVAIPKAGTYVYDLSGTTQSPLLGIPQRYQPGATLSIDVSQAGTEVTSKATSSQDQVQTTTKQTYQASRVLLTFSNLTFLGLASYDCTYAPPPELLPIPLQAGTLPTQAWSGAQCSGTLQLTVVGAETVAAAGQTWNAWRVHTVLHYVAQSSVDATADTTSLISPELGTIVTSDSTTSGKVAGSTFNSHQITSLKTHP